MHISLGPDCNNVFYVDWFFLCGLSGFLILSFVLVYVIVRFAEDPKFIIGSLLMACFTPGSYIWTAISNPGIY